MVLGMKVMYCYCGDGGSSGGLSYIEHTTVPSATKDSCNTTYDLTSQLAGSVPNTTSRPSKKFIPTRHTRVPPVIQPSFGDAAMMYGLPDG